MAILDFEAYKLEYLQEGRGSYDENGDFSHTPDVWVCVGRVNAVPAGRNNVIQLPDGSMETFSFTIIIHNPRCREYHYGERLLLKTVFGKEVRELTVKGFSRYQHQCKIFA